MSSLWEEALIRPVGTFPHGFATGEGTCSTSPLLNASSCGSSAFARPEPWEKVADRPDEGPLPRMRNLTEHVRGYSTGWHPASVFTSCDRKSWTPAFAGVTEWV